MPHRHHVSLLLVLSCAPSLVAQQVPAAGGSYAGARLVDAGAGHLAIVDVDLDGLDDVVLANGEGFRILRSLGDGRVVQSTHAYPNPGSTRALTALDWTGDGLPDLASLQAGVLHVLPGDGAGGGAALTAVPLPFGQSIGLDAGDLDGDGRADLLVGRSEPAELLALLADGAGGVGASVTTSVFEDVTSVLLDDLDGDGRLDVLGSTLDGPSSSLATWFGDGAGGATFGARHATASFIGGLDTGDLDGDGDTDVVASLPFGNEVLVWANQGDGSLAPAQGLAMSAPERLRVADFDLDGRLDLLVPSSSADAVSFVAGDGAGGFAAPEVLDVGNGPVAVDVLLLDGDPLPDLVVSGALFAGLGLHTGVGGGGLRLPDSVDVGSSLSGLAVGDLDGDGHDDVLATAGADGALWLLPGGGVERLGDPVVAAAGLGVASGVALGDVTADGWPDAVVSLFAAGGGVQLLANDGAGGLLAPVFHATGNNVTAVALGDMDEQGTLDVLTLDRASGQLSLLLADGAGGLGAADAWPVAFQPANLDIGDVDGDGVPDVAVVSDGATEMTLLLGRGGGGGDLDIGPPVEVGVNALDVALADADLDGDLDAVIVSTPGDRTRVFDNDGVGAFTLAHDMSATPGPAAVLVVDVDQDGVPDIVTGGVSGVGVHRGREGTGYWPVVEHLASGGNPATLSDLVAVDLEGSGFADLLAVGFGPRVTLLPNLGSPWWRLGGGVPGGPTLSSVGTLTPGSTLQLDAWGGAPGGTLWLVLGVSLADLPLGGGTLLPAFDLVLPLPLDGVGELHAAVTWPVGVPAGIPFWLQPWGVAPLAPGDALLGVTR